MMRTFPFVAVSPAVSSLMVPGLSISVRSIPVLSACRLVKADVAVDSAADSSASPATLNGACA